MKFSDKVHGFGKNAKEKFPGSTELEVIHKLIDETSPEAHMIDFLAAYEQVQMA